MTEKRLIPQQRQRPQVPVSYGVPTGEDGMLSWDWVMQRLRSARNYWVSTTRPDGRPHVVPVWGVVVDEVFYHGGGADTRKARNLDQNPAIAVHLESGDEVVILEGHVHKMTEANTDAALLKQIDDAYIAKYNTPHGTPVWALHPTKAIAWGEYPITVTRWTFGA